MNETLQTVFGLLGGLAIFLYGMNKMSDALQKAAGDRMKRIGNSSAPEQFRHHRYDYRIRQRRADQHAPGDFRDFRCQHRYHNDGTAAGV